MRFQKEKKISDFLAQCKERYGTQIPLLIVYENGGCRKVFYAEFESDVYRAAGALHSMQEEKIGLLAGNSYSWIVTAFAAFLTGKQQVLFDVNLNEQDLQELVDYSDVTRIITTDDLIDLLDFLPEKVQICGFSNLIDGQAKPDCRDETERASLICFTSGTSKSAKGVVIRAESVLNMSELVVDQLPGSPKERFFLPIPLHHIYAFTSVFHILQKGGTICLGQSPKRFQEELTAMDPEIAFLVPSMLRFMMDHDINSRSLRCLCTGGSSCAAAVCQQAIERGYLYYNLYGMSETLGYIANSRADHTDGWLEPVPGIRFFVNEQQELGIELPIHMEGYYKKDEEKDLVLKDDVLWTGDRAEIDAEGRAHIFGRLRDTIVLENGEKIHAEDKDQQLMRLPHIQEAAVFGSTEGLYAVIVPDAEENWPLICKALERYNNRYPSYCRIKEYWMQTQALPRTATGKLKRFLLEKKIYQAG